MITPGTADDAVGVTALYRLVYEDRLSTVAGQRYRITSVLPEDRLRYWKAERDGQLVGWAYSGLNTFATTTTSGFVGITVAPSHRCAGIGSALWKVASDHLDEIGVRRLVAQSDAQPESIAFLEHRGFSHAAALTNLAVDPRTVGVPPPPPDTLELRPLTAYAHEPEAVFHADRESILDEPGPDDFSGVTYETWKRHHWDNPNTDLELSLAAVLDSQIVGTTFLMSDRGSGRAMNGGTGVSRACRGRGLGLLMKRHSLAAAAAVGIERVVTQNDDTNAPMIAINEKLGYRPFSTSHSWVLER